ncbi:MAG: LLM class flavin-dependent oxidoreductase, partial [Planctomycetes bacterium]|nr:LLM class flavin-dependent oxidoreductase [Planctomycetota bacterium]
EECLTAMRQAWTGEAFEYEGRQVRVTPRPATPGGPPLMMGGNSVAAAQRAGRFGIGLMAEGGKPELAEVYAEACKQAGNEPGLCIVPPAGSVTSGFVAEDPDQAWAEMGPHLLHDAHMYSAWRGSSHQAASKSTADSVEALRAENGAYRIFTPEEAVKHIQSTGMMLMQPLCGGLPPKLAWPSLELMANKVMPAVKAASIHPDLRYASREVHARWDDIVLGGIRASDGMASFADVIDAPTSRAIQAYVIDRAHHDPGALERLVGWFAESPLCLPTSWMVD